MLLAYGLLAWLLLYPVFANPAREVLDPSSRPDGWLTAPVANWAMWALAWDWRILTTEPWRLFDANIFHPTPLALATSQPLLGHLPLFAPTYALTGNAVLAYQMNLLLAIALCGATMYALLRHWGAARTPAFFAGFVYAFCPIRMNSLTHLQIVAAQYFPLVLLFLDKTLATARLRYAIALLTFLLLQVLCSEELSYLTLIALLGYGAGILWHTRGRLSPRAAALVLLAVFVAAAAAYVVRLPRLQLESVELIPRADWLSWAMLDSSGWLSSYLLSPAVARLLGWNASLGAALYIGLIPLALAVIAMRGKRPNAAADGSVGWVRPALLGMIAVAYLMALGPEVQLLGIRLPTAQRLAMKLMPDFSTVVMPARFALILMAGVAALAGFGLQRVLTRLPRRRRLAPVAWGVTAMLLLATAIEYDLPFRPHSTRLVESGVITPPAYQALAKLPRGAVLEVPAVTCDLFDGDLESRYTAAAAAHWQPLINGYAVRPPIHRASIVAMAESLPDARATALLGRMAELRYVVVHLSRLRHTDRGRWRAPAGLRLAGFFGSDLLFEVEEPVAADLLPSMRAPTPEGETLLGTSLSPLPPQGRTANLVPAGSLSEAVNAGLDFKVKVLVSNESESTWPALAFGGSVENRVSLTYRWEDESGNIVAGHSAAAPLPYDLAPKGSVVASLCVSAPAEPGDFRLVVGLAQQGQWFADTTSAIPMTVVPLSF